MLRWRVPRGSRRARARRWVALWTVVVVATGCGDDDGARAPDAASDASADAGTGIAPAPPAAPVFTPCPTGWVEIEQDGIVVCHPLAGDTAECPPGQAHFLGDDACSPIGRCSAGEWPEDLPAGRPVVYVRAGAPDGGDGTIGAPFAAVGVAALRAPAEAVIAVARGTYAEGTIALRPRTAIVGACTAETILRNSAASTSAGVIDVLGPGIEVRSVTIAGARPGLYVVGTTERSAHVEGVVFDRTADMAIVAGEVGTVTGRDIVVRDTQPGPGGVGGRAVNVELGGSVSLDRVVLERNREAAVVASVGGSVSLRDAIVRDTDAQIADDVGGLAVAAYRGGRVHVERALLERSRGTAAYASDGGSELGLVDVVIREVFDGRTLDLAGHGVTVYEGAIATGSRVRIDRGTRYGILVERPGAALVLDDALVHDTVPGFTEQTGMGVIVILGAMLRANRVAIVRSVEVGIGTEGDGTTVELADVRVETTRSRSTDLRSGRGIAVQRGARLVGERVRIFDSREVGLFVGGAGARADLHDVAIEDTAGGECGVDGCEGPGGIGAGAYRGASFELTRFVVSGSVLAGLQIGSFPGEPFGAIDLHEGAVRNNEIGANVQDPAFDLARLMDRVVFRDNATTVDTTGLPVPDVTP